MCCINKRQNCTHTKVNFCLNKVQHIAQSILTSVKTYKRRYLHYIHVHVQEGRGDAPAVHDGGFSHAGAPLTHAHNEVQEVAGVVRHAVVGPRDVLDLSDVPLLARLLSDVTETLTLASTLLYKVI